MKMSQTGPVAEIVRFRLKDGVDSAGFVADAKGTKGFMDRIGGCLSRQLSCGDDGIWTDHVIWASMDQAQTAQAAAMKEPSFAPFMTHIDPTSVEMRHAYLCWSTQME